MPEKIVQLNEEVIKGQLKELVRGSVEETLNELLEAAATTTAISPPLPEISPSRCPSSRASPLRLQSLSGIAAVKAARERLSLRCIGWHIRPARGGNVTEAL